MTSTLEKFLNLLKQKTPEGVNPVDMLINIIPMSKEAAYRRLRGQIDFTFEDIVKIAQKLDISLDSLIKTNNEKNAYQVNVTSIGNGDSFMDDYIKWGENALDSLKKLRTNPNHYSLSIKNHVSILYLYKYKMISKLRLYKWMYQRNSNVKTIKLSEFIVAPRALTIEKMIWKELRQTRIFFIYSQELVKSLVDNINYFRNLNLLSKEECNQMIQETFMLLEDMEHDAILGKNQEMPCTIHVSNIKFDNDFTLWNSDNISIITFRPFGVNHYSINDPRVIFEMENWVKMLLKTSTLISFSGEKKRIEFFQHQRNLLEILLK
ncbi:MAG: hypothetical protein LBV72_12060 [Tannerella sp.]|jgi:hypothetical protein|nr:hypothetical protein [Tannerella sp.]